MNVPTIFETCRPRQDVLRGAITEADFAADLAQVIVGDAHPEYGDPARFFETTYPTRGISNLLNNVCERLRGGGGDCLGLPTRYVLRRRQDPRIDRSRPCSLRDAGRTER